MLERKKEMIQSQEERMCSPKPIFNLEVRYESGCSVVVGCLRLTAMPHVVDSHAGEFPCPRR